MAVAIHRPNLTHKRQPCSRESGVQCSRPRPRSTGKLFGSTLLTHAALSIPSFQTWGGDRLFLAFSTDRGAALCVRTTDLLWKMQGKVGPVLLSYSSLLSMLCLFVCVDACANKLALFTASKFRFGYEQVWKKLRVRILLPA
jgi:hypothetical protein